MHEKKILPPSLRHVRSLPTSKMVGRHDNGSRMQLSASPPAWTEFLDTARKFLRPGCYAEAKHCESGERTSSGNFQKDLRERKSFEGFVGSQVKGADSDEIFFIRIHLEESALIM